MAIAAMIRIGLSGVRPRLTASLVQLGSVVRYYRRDAMKQLHRPDLFGWSEFNPDRNIDFHSVLWVRDGGNVVIDPLPMSDHDRSHLDSLGGAAIIVVTNSDHLRDSAALRARTGARLLGPAGEKNAISADVDWWVNDLEDIVLIGNYQQAVLVKRTTFRRQNLLCKFLQEHLHSLYHSYCPC